MNKVSRFLWLEGIFDDPTVKAFRTISAASNFWQMGFVEALRRTAAHVEIHGYPVERVWPFGRLFVQGKHASLLPGFDGAVTGYLNLPALRGYFQRANLFDSVRRSMRSSGAPDWLVVFSCLVHADEDIPAIRIARYMRQRHGIPWICIVADGATPVGADRYVYLPWANFKSADSHSSAIHIDGGIAEVPTASGESQPDTETKVFMYMGALTEHGGVTELARAFTQLDAANVQLCICGRGDNAELDRLAATDARIRLQGFVETNDLNRMAHGAFAFVNPRSNSFAPNRLNYPSKLLHYLAYGKPVLSTFTDGVSPEYAEILVPIADASEAALLAAMRSVLSMPRDDYQAACSRVKRFNENHTWDHQVNRFLSWLA